MKLAASEQKKLEALRAKAQLTETEETLLDQLETKLAEQEGAPVDTSTYDEATVLISHAAILPMNAKGRIVALIVSMKDCPKVGLVPPHNALTFTQKQFDRLAMSLGIDHTSPSAVRQFVSAIGTDRTAAKVMIERYKKGSTYKSRDGVIVVRAEDGINPTVQSFILPDSLTSEMDRAFARVQERSWISASKFTSVGTTADTGAND
jgi:hypothetical protein